MPGVDLMDWFDLLTKYGFTIQEDRSLPLRIREIPLQGRLLERILVDSGMEDCFDEEEGIFCPLTQSFSEGEFLDAYYRNKNGYLDPHIARLVVMSNELGLETYGSCEGCLSGGWRRVVAFEDSCRPPDERPGRPFRGAYLDCDEYTRITLNMINPDLLFDPLRTKFSVIYRHLAPEEKARDLWNNLMLTAEIMATKRDRILQLAEAVKHALSIRADIMRG